jgi:pimeloyl-ACP methyl ester carboxylesterase
MSEMPTTAQRSQTAKPDAKGVPTVNWTTTSSSLIDTVQLVTGPFDALPVIFVPGIMGSNLKSINSGEPVWRLDMVGNKLPWTLMREYVGAPAGHRQRILHPSKVTVDPDGNVPGKNDDKKKWYRDAGWGEVAQGSYQSFLIWLETKLNPGERNPAKWRDFHQTQTTISAMPKPGDQPKLFPGVRMGLEGEPFGAEKTFDSILTDDLIAMAKFYMPVYAMGYNWLASNRDAAKLLEARINQLLSYYSNGTFRCQQVLLVTHSMGGLVARACAKLPGMADKIAGVVHGVMPSVGAAVAYRRCKVGMKTEDWASALVIGSTGKEVTAVFAQAPGALQLLPSQLYGSNWLKVNGPNGAAELSLPTAGGDPYESIYLERKKWWGLVNEAWLSPEGGVAIDWDVFVRTVDDAKKFHLDLGTSFHPNSYVYYGADSAQATFEKATWRIKAGLRPDERTPPASSSIPGLSSIQVRMDGQTPEYVGGKTEYFPYASPYGGGTTIMESSYWELHSPMQDGIGDGTVPLSSGSAPKRDGGAAVKQQFRMTGFSHEGSYKDPAAQKATLYAIAKIVGVAKRLT